MIYFNPRVQSKSSHITKRKPKGQQGIFFLELQKKKAKTEISLTEKNHVGSLNQKRIDNTFRRCLRNIPVKKYCEFSDDDEPKDIKCKANLLYKFEGLKEGHEDDMIVWDKDSIWYLDEIIARRLDKKGEDCYQCTWLNFPWESDEDTTFVPVKELEDSEMLHIYLCKIALKAGEPEPIVPSHWFNFPSNISKAQNENEYSIYSNGLGAKDCNYFALCVYFGFQLHENVDNYHKHQSEINKLNEVS